MQSYHYAWLSVHPERTEQWLKERLADGFHVHHIDGNHDNNDPKNLVLIESGDHMMLHNGSTRLLWRPPSGKKIGRPKKVPEPVISDAAVGAAVQSKHSLKVARKAAEARVHRAAFQRLGSLDTLR